MVPDASILEYNTKNGEKVRHAIECGILKKNEKMKRKKKLTTLLKWYLDICGPTSSTR